MTGLVVVLGDSISWGAGPEDGLVWHRRITNRPNAEWRSYAIGGFTIQNPPVSASTVAAMSSGYNEAILLGYMGINDVTGGRTGAQIFANWDSYRSTLQAAGWKVVVATLPNYTPNNTPGADFRTLLQASGSFDGVPDIAASLTNSGDSTYFDPDQIHLRSAGAAVVGSLFTTVMAGI